VVSQLDTIMIQAGIPALLRMFGDTATITPAARGAAAFTVSLMVDTEFRYLGTVVDVPETALLMECTKTAWTEPKRGDRIVYKGTRYQVDRLEPSKTNAYFWGFWAIPA